jgi:hypothetical protein
MSLVNGIMKFVENYSADVKRELIARITKSINAEASKKKPVSRRKYAEWIPEKTAEELCKEIRDSRTFNRENESFD